MKLTEAQARNLNYQFMSSWKRVHDELVIGCKSLTKYITALRCMVVVQITIEEQAAMENWGVWDSVKEIRYIFIYSIPQNQAIVSINSMLKKPEETSEEVVGIFSLTALKIKLTIENVRNFIYDKIADEIIEFQKSGISYDPSVVDDKEIFVKRDYPGLIQAEELAPFEDSICAIEYMKLSIKVRDIITTQVEMVKKIVSNGMSIKELEEYIQKRILRQPVIKGFLDKHPIYHLQFLEMEGNKFPTVLEALKNRYVGAFFKQNGYLFPRFEKLNIIQWSRLKKLLETWYAHTFILLHIYLIEYLLPSDEDETGFLKIISIFNAKKPFNYLEKIFDTVGFYYKVKESNKINHIFSLLSDSVMCTFLVAHEALLLPIIEMGDPGVENALLHIQDKKVRLFLGKHPDRLKKAGDWALIKRDAYKPLS